MSSPWKDLELETRELVASCRLFNAESGSASISGSDNVRRFEQIMPILIERIEDDLIEYNISTDHVHSELRDFLADLKDNPEAGKYFTENFDEFEQRIQDISSTQYTVAFALNFHFPSRRKRDEFSELGYEIERLPRRQWLSQHSAPTIPGCSTARRRVPGVWVARLSRPLSASRRRSGFGAVIQRERPRSLQLSSLRDRHIR